MISSLSYGAYNPSITMRRSMEDHAAQRRGRRGRALRAAMELVVECVHPGNLGALPPSPKVLVAKAHQLGLLTAEEAWGFDY